MCVCVCMYICTYVYVIHLAQFEGKWMAIVSAVMNLLVV